MCKKITVIDTLSDVLTDIMDASIISRRDGILALTEFLEEANDDVFKALLTPLIDGCTYDDTMQLVKDSKQYHMNKLNDKFDAIEIGIGEIQKGSTPSLIMKRLTTRFGQFKENV